VTQLLVFRRAPHQLSDVAHKRVQFRAHLVPKPDVALHDVDGQVGGAKQHLNVKRLLGVHHRHVRLHLQQVLHGNGVGNAGHSQLELHWRVQERLDGQARVQLAAQCIRPRVDDGVSNGPQLTP
jgi:hypothetical protein